MESKNGKKDDLKNEQSKVKIVNFKAQLKQFKGHEVFACEFCDEGGVPSWVKATC